MSPDGVRAGCRAAWKVQAFRHLLSRGSCNTVNAALGWHSRYFPADTAPKSTRHLRYRYQPEGGWSSAAKRSLRSRLLFAAETLEERSGLLDEPTRYRWRDAEVVLLSTVHLFFCDFENLIWVGVQVVRFDASNTDCLLYAPKNQRLF